MADIQTHVISRPIAAALDVDVGTLVHVEILEQQILPVDVGISVRIFAAARIFDNLCRIDWRCAAAGHIGFVIDVHPSSSIGIFDHVGGLDERIFDGHTDLGTGVLLTFFRRDDHHAVGTAHAVDGRCGCIFENREVFDRFSGNLVQIRSRYFDIVQKDEWCSATSESSHAADVEICGFARSTGLSHRNHASQFARKSRRER